MRRVSRKRPRYNCGPGGSRCQHEKKGDHGIAADEWLYSVISDDGRHGVTLMVMSSDYPPDVDRTLFSERMQKPMGATLWFHEAASEGQGQPCDLLPCGRCTGDASYLQAQELWDEHHVGEQFEQPDSFWIALEARLPDDPLAVAVGEGVAALATEIARGLGCSSEDVAQALAAVEEQKRSS